MTVDDILSVLKETTDVWILKDGMIEAKYGPVEDGHGRMRRKSIDPKYKSCKVKSIYAPNRIFTLCIVIE